MPVMVAANWLSFSDAVILVAVIGAAVKVIADQRGWTRSPALVRQENADLRERNATLTAEVQRLDALDREKAERIAALEAEVRQLQERDQAAVLSALSKHEESVHQMWQETISVSEKMVTQMTTHETNANHRNEESRIRHEEALSIWRDIRDGLQRGQSEKGGEEDVAVR